jgi:hypothetical protein
MNPAKTIRRVLYAVLVLFFFLHNDLWLWDDARLFVGLPAGLSYHIAYCFVAVVLLYLLVCYAWPKGLDELSAGEKEQDRDNGDGSGEAESRL